MTDQYPAPENTDAYEVVQLRLRVKELEAQLNDPETVDFATGVVREAAHQRERWGESHDKYKTAWDWFWLIGYLSQKAANAYIDGNYDKARHHCISTAAALANWHRKLTQGGL